MNHLNDFVLLLAAEAQILARNARALCTIESSDKTKTEIDETRFRNPSTGHDEMLLDFRQKLTHDLETLQLAFDQCQCSSHGVVTVEQANFQEPLKSLDVLVQNLVNLLEKIRMSQLVMDNASPGLTFDNIRDLTSNLLETVIRQLVKDSIPKLTLFLGEMKDFNHLQNETGGLVPLIDDICQELQAEKLQLEEMQRRLMERLLVFVGQPDPLILHHRIFTASLQLLCHDSLLDDIDIDLTRVQASVLDEHLLQKLVQEGPTDDTKRGCASISLYDSVPKRVKRKRRNSPGSKNGAPAEAGTFDRRTSIKFEQVKILEHPRTRRTMGQRVMDQKYCLLFFLSCTDKISGKMFQMWTCTSPFTFGINFNQKRDGCGTIFWHQYFHSVAQPPFWTPETVPWSQMREAIRRYLTTELGTIRQISDKELDYIGRRVVLPPDQGQYQDYDLVLVDKNRFIYSSNQHRPSPWSWLYAVVQLVQKHLQEFWNNGLLLFVERESPMLKEADKGHFVLRFSESVLGSISVSYVDMVQRQIGIENEDSETMKDIKSIYPFTEDFLKNSNLAEAVLANDFLKMVYFYRNEQEHGHGFADLHQYFHKVKTLTASPGFFNIDSQSPVLPWTKDSHALDKSLNDHDQMLDFPDNFLEDDLRNLELVFRKCSDAGLPHFQEAVNKLDSLVQTLANFLDNGLSCGSGPSLVSIKTLTSEVVEKVINTLLKQSIPKFLDFLQRLKEHRHQNGMNNEELPRDYFWTDSICQELEAETVKLEEMFKLLTERVADLDEQPHKNSVDNSTSVLVNSSTEFRSANKEKILPFTTMYQDLEEFVQLFKAEAKILEENTRAVCN